MNYKALKWVIDWLINSHKCPNCNSSINESSIDIIWAAWSTINIDISCPSCDKHSMVKAEIAQIDVSNLKVNDIKNWNIKKQIINQLKWWSKNKNLKESDISELTNKLKKTNINIWDLLGD